MDYSLPEFSLPKAIRFNQGTLLAIIIFFFFIILSTFLFFRIQKVNNLNLYLTIDKIGVILSSVFLVLVISKKESIDKELNKFIGLFQGYFNYSYIAQYYYYQYLNLLAFSLEDKINYFNNFCVEPNNPLLKVGCGETEIEYIKNWQNKIKELSDQRNTYNFLKNAIIIEIVISLVLR